MRQAFLILSICVAILCIPTLSHAQLQDAFTLQVSPQLPSADSVYSVTLAGDTTKRISVRWYINGIENTSFKNINSISLTSGGVGSATTIVARVGLTDGSVAEARRTIVPDRLDLIVEADTTAPSFYQGRRLPSNGSLVRVTALPFTKERLPASRYSYIWKLNNKIQNGGALRGENVFTVTPSFESEIILSVDVLDQTNKLIASKSLVIPLLKPELYFYEKNPLRGLSPIALADPFIFVGDETTLRAGTYFMNNSIPDSDLLIEWKLDGRVQQNNDENPQEITLRRSGNTGESKLSFHIHNLKEILQGIQESITIRY